MGNKERYIKLLEGTQREGIKDLITFMEKQGFFKAPCSSKYHLNVEGGLVKHSLNVYDTLKKASEAMNSKFMEETLIIVALLHDLGKMGDFGKEYYVPNTLKSGKVSEAQPYKVNDELLPIPHEARSTSIAWRYIKLTEQEEFAIEMHNGMYGSMKYDLQGHETPLYLLLHFADMWATRVLEK